MPKNIGLYNNNLSVPRKQDIDNVASQIPTQIEAHNTSSDPHANMNWITKEEAPKTVVRFVVGTSTAGWTADDCDYLCDGTDDQVEINAAIQALPSTGGEIKILDGTYNISAKISLNKNNVKLSGNGNSTILKRMWDSSSKEGIVSILYRKNNCYLTNFNIDGNNTVYTSSNNIGIVLSGHNNIVSNNFVNNNYNGIEISYTYNNNTIIYNTCNNNTNFGIYTDRNNNTIISNNICNDNNSGGIYVYVVNSNISQNIAINNSNYGMYISRADNTIITNNINNNSKYGIYTTSTDNSTVAHNICNNNDSGIYLLNSGNNVITGNTCIRGTGQPSDYTASQNTIMLNTQSKNNLIASNIIMGKNIQSGFDISNTVYGNKWNETIDILITPSGTQGQVLGYISDNVVGAIDLPQGKIVNSTAITNSNWTSSGSYVYQQITCEGMTANSLPFIVPQYNVLNDSQQNDWNKIVYIESFEGYCRIYAKASFANNINVMITY